MGILRGIFALVMLVLTFYFVFSWLGFSFGFGNYPRYIPFLGGTTPQELLMRKMEEFGIPPILNFLPKLLGIVLVMLAFHAVITSPTIAANPVSSFFANIIVFLAVFILIGIDWVGVSKEMVGYGDYASCLTREFTSIEWIKTGVSPWEKCKEEMGKKEVILRKVGSYSFLNVRLGTEELDFKVPNIVPGKNYTLWFTISNLKEGRFQANKIVVNSYVYNHTRLNLTEWGGYLNITYTTEGKVKILSKPKSEVVAYFPSDKDGWYADYNKTKVVPGDKVTRGIIKKKATCVGALGNGNILEVGDNACFAEVFIPKEDKSYIPVIEIEWNQSVEGYEKFKIVADRKFYERHYRPICVEKAGVTYSCPTTTEGPIDLGLVMIPRQVIKDVSPSIVAKISNRGKGVGMNFEIDLPETVGEITSTSWERCKSEIKRGILIGELKSGKEIITSPCMVEIEFPANIPYRETLIKVTGSYTYLQSFELGEISA